MRRAGEAGLRRRTNRQTAHNAPDRAAVGWEEAHATGNGNGGRAGAQISVYGPELSYTTWRWLSGAAQPPLRQLEAFAKAASVLFVVGLRAAR